MVDFTPEARQFLQKPWIGRLATTKADGAPHVVPLWYILDGDDVVIISERKTAKIAHLLRDNRAALLVGGEPENGPAYLLQGRVTITDDPVHAMTERVTRHYESPEQAEKDLAEWAAFDMVILRLTVERVTKAF